MRVTQPDSMLIRGAVVAVGLVWAGAAVAQQQVDNGNALDANNRVGSGGQNQAVGQVDYAARNNIITGNVAGGRAFQGQINYAAPGDFRGNLGSNALFDFRASSLASSPLVSDVAGARFNSSAAASGGASVSVYRGFANVSGDTLGRQGVVALDGGSKGIFQGARLGNNTRLDSLFGGSTRHIEADTLGGAQTTPVQTDLSNRITISPLLGVRPTQRPDEDSLGDVDTEEPTRDSLIRPQPEEKDAPQRAGSVSSGQVNPTRVGQMAGTLNTVPSSDATGAPPGLVIGQQMQSLVSANRTGETMDQRVARLERMIFRATDPQVAGRGNDVYRNLVTQMRESKAEPQRTEAFDAGLEDPEAKQIEQAEAEAQSALERAYAMFGKPVETPADGAGNGEGTGEPAEDPMDDLLEQLRTSLPRVDSLAGDAEDQSNQLMKMAEERLHNGKYFDAEALYRQARNSNPGNPMAQVGLIHAQMGAGLIRSASFNLHKLFEDHPELINVRYQGRVLPPKDRLRWLQGELQRMIDSERYGAEPGLMLAYLGHQTESRQLVRYGLAVAEAKAPRDALLKVLRAVWLETGDDAKDAAPAKQPKQDTPPAPDEPAPALDDALDPAPAAAPAAPEK